MCVGGGETGVYGYSVLAAQFCYEPETTLKTKAYYLKKCQNKTNQRIKCDRDPYMACKA